MGGSAEGTIDAAADSTAEAAASSQQPEPALSQQPEHREPPVVADGALPSRQAPSSDALSAVEAEAANGGSTAAADEEFRPSDSAELAAPEATAVPAAGPTAQAAPKAEPATPPALPTQQPSSAAEVQLTPPAGRDQATDVASGAESTDPGALQLLVGQLRRELAAREGQLERGAAEAGQLQAALQAVTRKNEELVKAKAKVSEQDVEEMQR